MAFSSSLRPRSWEETDPFWEWRDLGLCYIRTASIKMHKSYNECVYLRVKRSNVNFANHIGRLRQLWDAQRWHHWPFGTCDLWKERADRHTHRTHSDRPHYVTSVSWPTNNNNLTKKKPQKSQCPVTRWLLGAATGSHRREIKRWRTTGMPRATDVAATSQLGCSATALFPRISGSGKTPHGFAEVECWFQTSGYLPRIPPSPMLPANSHDVEDRRVTGRLRWWIQSERSRDTRPFKCLDTHHGCLFFNSHDYFDIAVLTDHIKLCMYYTWHYVANKSFMRIFCLNSSK